MQTSTNTTTHRTSLNLNITTNYWSRLVGFYMASNKCACKSYAYFIYLLIIKAGEFLPKVFYQNFYTPRSWTTFWSSNLHWVIWHSWENSWGYTLDICLAKRSIMYIINYICTTDGRNSYITKRIKLKTRVSSLFTT